MPAARYWRINNIATYGGSDLSLTEAWLYTDTAPAGAGVAPTCSHAPTTGALANLSDDNSATGATFAGDAVRSGGFYLEWDLGAAVDVRAVRLGAGASRATFVRALTLEFRASTSDRWQVMNSFGDYKFPGANTMTAVPVQGDPYWGYVTALLRFEGDLTDEKGHTFTAYGSAAVSASSPLIGGGSFYSNGAGGNYVMAPDSTDWDVGPSDFCYEGWAKSSNAGYLQILLTRRFGGSSMDYGPTIYINGGGLAAHFGAANGSVVAACSGGSISNGQRFHWRYAREGSTFRLFLNGTAVGSATSTAAGASGSPLTIGRDASTNGREWYGWQDEIRLTNGVSRGLSNFTIEPEPFPAGASSDSEIFEANPINPLSIQRARFAHSAPLNPFRTPLGADLQARDTEFGGRGALTGTTSIKGDPTNAPTRAKVTVLRRLDKAVARVGWSDAAGNFSFPGLDTANQQFIALAEYPSNPADPTAEGYMRPVAGVSKLDAP